MISNRQRAFEILEEAEDRFEAVEAGLDVIKAGPYQLKAGFRNVAVFGRMVTFVTNNLRGKIAGFDAWDSEAKERHFGEGLGAFMNAMRLAFEKQATNPITSSTYIRHFDTSMLQRLPRPKNAVSFFIGDRTGGSGWMLEMDNGDKFPYYIDLPGEIGTVTPMVSDGKTSHDLVAVSERYVKSLGAYLRELRTFLEEAFA